MYASYNLNFFWLNILSGIWHIPSGMMGLNSMFRRISCSKSIPGAISFNTTPLPVSWNTARSVTYITSCPLCSAYSALKLICAALTTLFFNLYPAVRDITFQPAGCQGPYEYDLLCGLGYIDEPSHPVYTFTEAADVYITLLVKFSK